MTSTIEDYAIIGDGRSCALVAKTGSIDFLCWPQFDSDTCFAALLGDERHGYWLISPPGYVSETTRSYREGTAILDTEHVTETGRLSNDVGLLSEEHDVRGRKLIGNFLQALTHLGVINTALFLSGPVIQRAGG